jgi:drug/metabolite transporter (DMT)-like permease
MLIVETPIDASSCQPITSSSHEHKHVIPVLVAHEQSRLINSVADDRESNFEDVEAPDENCGSLSAWWNPADRSLRQWRRARVAELVLILVNFVFGSSFVARKDSYNASSPILSLGIMFVFALLPLLPVYLRDVKREHWKPSLFCGTILFASYALQTLGLNQTTPQKSAFITALYVKLIPIISFLVTFKRPTIVEITGLIIAMLGTYLLTTGGASLVFTLGDILTFLCTVGFAAHTVAIDLLSNADTFASINLGQIFWVAVWSFATAPALEHVQLRPDSSAFWVAEAFGGVLATGIALTAMSWSMAYLSVTRTAFLCALEPVFAAVSSYLFYHEGMSQTALLGAALVLFGIIVGALPYRTPCDPPQD